MSTRQMYAGKGNNLPSTEQTGEISPQTAQNQARSSFSIPADWNAVERMVNQAAQFSASREPSQKPIDSAFRSDDPLLNLQQAQADLGFF